MAQVALAPRPRNPSVRSASCAPSRGAPDLLTLARDFRRCAGACRRRGEPELARRMERRARALAAGKTLADLARAGDGVLPAPRVQRCEAGRRPHRAPDPGLGHPQPHSRDPHGRER